ncbi:MAG TPA: DinB family protein [Bryobacteraceae bacterium]|nr:DinB family protein [Bryobacteraceae bacterium]
MKLLALGIVGIFVAQAQQPASVATSAKGAYTRIKNNFVKAAEKMPEENYGFKPVDALETFGQRVAHIADPQLGTCTGLTGARKTGMAKSKTSKAELVAAIKESFDACDKAFDALTDANALEAVSAGRGQQPRIAVLYGLIAHANEVYGAMGVYMRLKGIVPPSSEGR